MGLAETAKLIVELNLRDRLSGPLNRVNQSLAGLGVNTGLVGKGVGQIGTGLGVAGVRLAAFGVAAAAIAGPAVLGLLARNVSAGVSSLRELENAQAQTEAAIRSTGGAAGLTAQEIRDMSEAFEDQNALIDDKVIQAGANVLLTFRHIRKDAFQPALESALDLSTVLDQDLQTSVLQIGKALEDPIRGVTALRRAGVQLSEAQEDQIKQLIEQNDLYGAQRIILDELAIQIGGRFAAAGRTATAQSAKLGDKIEELQQILAKPIVPVIEKITVKLIDLFEKPATQAAVSNLGTAIAGIFSEENLNTAVSGLSGFLSKLTPETFTKVGDGIRDVFGFLATVPWATIGEGLRITGQAAKIAVDAFLSLPKEVQGIVIAGLAVNKLSGGLIGLGGANVLKGLFGAGGLLGRGTTPFNALFVTVTNPGFGGTGGGPGAFFGGGGKGGGLGGLLLGGVSKVLAGLFVAELAVQLTSGGQTNLFDALIKPVNQPRIFHPEAPGGGKPTPSKPVPVEVVRGQSKLFGNVADIAGLTQQGGMFAALPSWLKNIIDTTGGVPKPAALPDTALAPLKVPLDKIAANTSKLPPILTAQEILNTRLMESRQAAGRGIPERVDTVLPAAGGVGRLLDTALPLLRETAAATRQLPPILTRAERASQLTAQRINDAKVAQLQGLASIRTAVDRKQFRSDVTANVTVNTYVSGTMFARQQTVTQIAAGYRGGIPIGPG